MIDLIIGLLLLLVIGSIVGVGVGLIYRAIRRRRQRHEAAARIRRGRLISPEAWAALIDGESEETIREWISQIRAMRDAAKGGKT